MLTKSRLKEQQQNQAERQDQRGKKNPYRNMDWLARECRAFLLAPFQAGMWYQRYVVSHIWGIIEDGIVCVRHLQGENR